MAVSDIPRERQFQQVVTHFLASSFLAEDNAEAWIWMCDDFSPILDRFKVEVIGAAASNLFRRLTYFAYEIINLLLFVLIANISFWA